MIIEYQKNERLMNNYDLYQSLKASEEERKLLEQQVVILTKATESLTRLMVENAMLRDEIKRLKEGK